eukprot:SAG11_NODE_157_length_14147_cov_8.545202_18_plen_90_part_00
MQARIERLHAFQQQGGAQQRWFDAPGGSDSLPKAKVEIDSALLLTPRAGMQVRWPNLEGAAVRPILASTMALLLPGRPQRQPDGLCAWL